MGWRELDGAPPGADPWPHNELSGHGRTGTAVAGRLVFPAALVGAALIPLVPGSADGRECRDKRGSR